MTELASRSAAAQDLTHLPLERLRSHRRDLMRECARASRWRRLLQARLDLTVDAVLPAEDLEGEGALASLRSVLDAAAPVAAPSPDLVEQLRRVQQARQDLAVYADRLRRELTATTAELVERYTVDPARCVPAPAPERG